MGVWAYRGIDLSSYRDIAKGRVSEWAKRRMGVGMSSCSSGNVVAALPRRLCNRSVPLEYKTRMSGSSSYRRTPLRRFAHSPFRFLAPLALYTPSLSRHITPFMEVDFQAIKLEELKSRLGELRRYL
jgi:hypothetical protein